MSLTIGCSTTRNNNSIQTIWINKSNWIIPTIGVPVAAVTNRILTDESSQSRIVVSCTEIDQPALFIGVFPGIINICKLSSLAFLQEYVYIYFITNAKLIITVKIYEKYDIHKPTTNEAMLFHKYFLL